MVSESIAVLAITLCMIVLFVRSGRKEYAASITPLLLVPLSYVLGLTLFQLLEVRVFSFPVEMLLAFCAITAVAVSGVLIFAFSGKIVRRRNRQLYVALACGYNIILGCTYIFRTLSPLMQQ
jgi:exosortase/archaeosortase